MKERTVVLLTGTINPKNTPYVKIGNPQDRLRDYIKSIIMWILFANTSTIVFCENSDYHYNYDLLYEIARLEQKELEIIVFDGNSKSKEYGKGYGEGLIIEHALCNSKILSTVDSFYKVTGRLFVENFNSLAEHHKDDPIVFNKTSPRSKMVDTRFFKTSIRFYKDNLIKEYEKVRESEGIYLEHVFYKKLHGKPIPCFKRHPRFIGRSGSTGIVYNNPKWKLLIKDIFQIFGLYKV